MRHEAKKIGRIIDELTTLLLKDDTNHLDLRIETGNQETRITIIDYNTHYSAGEIACFERMLNQQRQYEIEEYYWQLAGETDESDELVIVSAMIDRAKLELQGNNLYIELVRKH